MPAAIFDCPGLDTVQTFLPQSSCDCSIFLSLLTSPMAPLSSASTFVVYRCVLVSSFCFPFFTFSDFPTIYFLLPSLFETKLFGFCLIGYSFFFQSAAQYLTIVLFLVLQVSSGNCLCSERSSKFLILWLFQPSQSQEECCCLLIIS